MTHFDKKVSFGHALRAARLGFHDSKPRLILLGSKVSAAFGMKFAPFKADDWHGLRWLALPHPSGLCRLWNEPGAVQRARDAVGAFAPEVADLLGVADGY